MLCRLVCAYRAFKKPAVRYFLFSTRRNIPFHFYLLVLRIDDLLHTYVSYICCVIFNNYRSRHDVARSAPLQLRSPRARLVRLCHGYLRHANGSLVSVGRHTGMAGSATRASNPKDRDSTLRHADSGNRQYIRSAGAALVAAWRSPVAGFLGRRQDHLGDLIGRWGALDTAFHLFPDGFRCGGIGRVLRP